MLLRRAGLIGDVHAEDVLLESAIECLSAANVDALLCTGDVVDGLGNVDRCCELLHDHAVLTVRGNHDNWILHNVLRVLPNAHQLAELAPQSRDFIRRLPATVELETPAGSLLLCHGLGEDDMWVLRSAADDPSGIDTNNALYATRDWTYRSMVGGHTHHRMVRQLGQLAVINPGTLKRDQEPCIALVDFDARTVQFFERAAAWELADEVSLPAPEPE